MSSCSVPINNKYSSFARDTYLSINIMCKRSFFIYRIADLRQGTNSLGDAKIHHEAFKSSGINDIRDGRGLRPQYITPLPLCTVHGQLLYECVAKIAKERKKKEINDGG